jgi:hypothetical protein
VTTTGLRKANLRSNRTITAMLAVLTTVVAACSASGGSDIPAYQSNGAADSGATSTHLTKLTYASTDEVLAAVAAAQQTQVLPDSAAKQLVALSQGEAKISDGPEHCFDERKTARPTPNTMFGECAYGDPNGTKQMVLFGDSRAPMWAATLERVAAITGWQVRVFAKGGCPVADLQVQNSETNAHDEDCDKFRPAAVDEIRKLHPQLVITASHAGRPLVNGEWPTPEQWQDGWVSSLQKLAQPDTRLAILGAIPNWENGGARCVAAHPEDIQACSSDPTGAVRTLGHSEAGAAAATGALYVDTVPWVCAEKCEPVIADIVVYNDPYHFTKMYADYLSGAVAEALKPAMA